jgi:hypothetical protein
MPNEGSFFAASYIAASSALEAVIVVGPNNYKFVPVESKDFPLKFPIYVFIGTF